MNTYFNVKIKYKLEDDQGKLKSITEEYLVSGINFSDAEFKASEFAIKEQIPDFVIDKVTKTKILDVINYGNE